MKQWHDLTRASFMVALMALSAHLQIPIGPVPITLQTMICIMTGRMLGVKWGALSMMAYGVIGLMGLPVFAGGSGPAYVLGPTFGYVVGFIPAAMIAGLLGKQIKSVWRQFLSVTTALFIIYLFGVTHLYFVLTVVQDMDIHFYQALRLGVFPFLMQDFLTGLLGVYLFERVQVARQIQSRQPQGKGTK